MPLVPVVMTVCLPELITQLSCATPKIRNSWPTSPAWVKSRSTTLASLSKLYVSYLYPVVAGRICTGIIHKSEETERKEVPRCQSRITGQDPSPHSTLHISAQMSQCPIRLFPSDHDKSL